MGGNEQKNVNEVFDTNWVAPLGPNVNGMEKDLEQYLGNESHVGALRSVAAAIHLGIVLLGLQAEVAKLSKLIQYMCTARPN